MTVVLPGKGKLVSKRDSYSCGRYTMVLANALRIDFQLALLGGVIFLLFCASRGVTSTGIYIVFVMLSRVH